MGGDDVARGKLHVGKEALVALDQPPLDQV